jgi:hypothetical protein
MSWQDRIGAGLFILWMAFLACCAFGGFHHFLMLTGVLK